MTPVRVGIADSGLNPRHRQIGTVGGGVGVRVGSDGAIQVDDDWLDRLGHGTAVAATIHGHAPEAELYPIRIFRRRLEAHADALSYAIEWALSHELDVLNLSLGCSKGERESELERACESAALILVAPTGSLPRAPDNVVSVRDDPGLDEGEVRFERGVFVASSWARSLGELRRERNFHGTSFAVAHVSGMIACALAEGVPKQEVVSALRERCETIGP